MIKFTRLLHVCGHVCTVNKEQWQWQRGELSFPMAAWQVSSYQLLLFVMDYTSLCIYRSATKLMRDTIYALWDIITSSRYHISYFCIVQLI